MYKEVFGPRQAAMKETLGQSATCICFHLIIKGCLAFLVSLLSLRPLMLIFRGPPKFPAQVVPRG